MNSPTAKAIRNRRVLLGKEIKGIVQAKDGAAHVTSLACGPAEEIFDVFQELDDRCRLYASLVDIDQALAHAADRREHAELQDRISLINANLGY